MNFQCDDKKVTAIVENHADANVDVLFHAKGEECKSTHPHKVGVHDDRCKRNLKALVLEMT